MVKEMSLTQAKAILPRPVAMKSASREFLAWFRQHSKTDSPKAIVAEFSASNMQLVQGSASNQSQRLLQLGEWAAGVGVGKVNRQAKQILTLTPLCVAHCAYTAVLKEPPADLGALQLKEIKNKREAAGALILMVAGIVPRPLEMPIFTRADFVRVSFHDL